VAIWHGTKVAVKELYTGDLADERLRQFRSELDLLQKLRHPNVVQFLGAVTQSAPLMIVTEFLPLLDLAEHLKKGRLDPEKAVIYALDIARYSNTFLSKFWIASSLLHLWTIICPHATSWQNVDGLLAGIGSSVFCRYLTF
jgi:serine/threonine protein kinase